MTRSLFPDPCDGFPIAQCVLRLENRYKVCLASALRRVLYPPAKRNSPEVHAEVQDVLAQLVESGHLQQLSGASFLARHAYVLAGHELKPTDISRHWWCCLDSVQRPLITYPELKPLYAAEGIKPPFHNYSHAIVSDEGGPALCRIYQCSASSRKNIREQIRRHLTVNAKSFAHWIDEGSYRLAILVTSESKRRMVENLITEPYRDSPPLAEQAGITVSVVPNEQTLPAMHAEYLEREGDG